MNNAQPNPAISVAGSVQVLWSTNNDPTSYIVLFSGAMVEGNVNNAFSTDQENLPVNSDQIIVAAYLAG